MTNYIMPKAEDVIASIWEMDGKILLDTSASTLPVGVEKEGKIRKQSMLDYALHLALCKSDGYITLMEEQTKYVQGLRTLADDNVIFTIDDVVKKEMNRLKIKSGFVASQCKNTPDFTRSVLEFRKNIKDLLNSLRKKIVSPKPYLMDKVMGDIKKIRFNNGERPSKVDKRIFASAVCESAGNGRVYPVNIVTNDHHILTILGGYAKAENMKSNPLNANICCYLFDEKAGFELSEKGVYTPGLSIVLK
jgi:hypothetical protein